MTPTIPAASHRGRRSIRSTVAAALATITLVGTIACGGDSSTGPSNKGPAGSYNLVQVDAKGIPVEIYRGPYYDPDLGYSYQLVLNVTDGTIELQPDGGFHLTVDRTWTSGGRTGNGVLTVDGTYRIDGSKILIDTDGGAGSGAFENGQISLSLDVGETGTMRRYTFRRT